MNNQQDNLVSRFEHIREKNAALGSCNTIEGIEQPT
jgi:hypothetical protein